jgi:hypothetical protein
MSSRFQKVQVPFLVTLDVIMSKVQVLYTRVNTKYTTRPYISLGTKLFWTEAGVACFTSATMVNLRWLYVVLGESSLREKALWGRKVYSQYFFGKIHVGS